MACFTAPLAQALVVTAAKSACKDRAARSRNPFVRRLGWLQKMLFGGSFLLAIEHVWHGEITWRYPFLTAVEEGPEATSEMWHEIATVGISMAVLITVVWVGMVLVSSAAGKRRAPAAQEA